MCRCASDYSVVHNNIIVTHIHNDHTWAKISVCNRMVAIL